MSSIEMKSASDNVHHEDTNSRDGTEPTVELEQSLRSALLQHFQNPFAICGSRKTGRSVRGPVKLVMLAAKILFVVITLVKFGNERASFAKYLDRNSLALKRLLLMDWTTLYETMPYPPATGQYALYSIDEVTSHINYAIRKVSSLHMTSVGSMFVSNDSPVNLCVDYYDLGIYNMATNDIQFDQTRRKVCQDVGIHANNEYHLNLSTLDSMGGDNLNLSIPDLMKGDKGSLVRLIRVQIVFTVHSIHVNMESSDTSPRCFHIQGTIEFDNSDINGQIPIHLLSDASEMVCTVNGATSSSGEPSVFVLCSISILFTALSFVLSLRSVVTAIHLCCKTRKHIRTKFGTPLTLSEQLEIVNAKEFVTLIGDVISFCGFLFYIVLNSRVLRSSSTLYDISGLLLGTGLILSCFGVLHFLSFSPGFHILFDVMGKSILPVLRFLLCAAVLFVAFALCGWIVMGPYHIKFSSIYSTFRCLFGLIAGDEVYVTLAAIGEDFSFSWWFCAVFITFYSIMFTIVALNILIAIFTASYDSIKSHTIRNRVRSTLIRFMNE